MHVVRVGTLAKHVWFGVLDPSKPLPSSGKTTQDATRDIDFRFKNGKIRQEHSGELRALRGSIATVGTGIVETNELHREAHKTGTAEVGSSINAAHDLMKLYGFKDELKNQAHHAAQGLDNAKRRKR